MLLYPGMLLAPALYQGRGRVVIGGLCYGFLMLYSFWYYRDQGSSWAETLIVGQRYFLAALPLWIVAYSAVGGRVLQRLSSKGTDLSRLLLPSRFCSVWREALAPDTNGTQRISPLFAPGC